MYNTKYDKTQWTFSLTGSGTGVSLTRFQSRLGMDRDHSLTVENTLEYKFKIFYNWEYSLKLQNFRLKTMHVTWVEAKSSLLAIFAIEHTDILAAQWLE